MSDKICRGTNVSPRVESVGHFLTNSMTKIKINFGVNVAAYHIQFS